MIFCCRGLLFALGRFDFSGRHPEVSGIDRWFVAAGFGFSTRVSGRYHLASVCRPFAWGQKKRDSTINKNKPGRFDPFLCRRCSVANAVLPALALP